MAHVMRNILTFRRKNLSYCFTMDVIITDRTRQSQQKATHSFETDMQPANAKLSIPDAKFSTESSNSPAHSAEKANQLDIEAEKSTQEFKKHAEILGELKDKLMQGVGHAAALCCSLFSAEDENNPLCAANEAFDNKFKDLDVSQKLRNQIDRIESLGNSLSEEIDNALSTRNSEENEKLIRDTIRIMESCKIDLTDGDPSPGTWQHEARKIEDHLTELKAFQDNIICYRHLVSILRTTELAASAPLRKMELFYKLPDDPDCDTIANITRELDCIASDIAAHITKQSNELKKALNEHSTRSLPGVELAQTMLNNITNYANKIVSKLKDIAIHI
jgi:hypothetical protein